MDLGISGRTAIICASSKGLGLGCAEALAAEGVNLVMNARGAETLEASAEAIRTAHGVTVKAVAADITTPDGRADVLAAAGEVDILVNNAGITRDTLLPVMTDEQWDDVIAVNLRGTFLFTRAVSKQMITDDESSIRTHHQHLECLWIDRQPGPDELLGVQGRRDWNDSQFCQRNCQTESHR